MEAVKPAYTIPDIKSWKRYIATLQTEEQLNAATILLKSARVYAGVHPFLQTNEMGLAIWLLTNRGNQLGYYKLSDGTFRKTLTPNQ